MCLAWLLAKNSPTAVGHRLRAIRGEHGVSLGAMKLREPRAEPCRPSTHEMSFGERAGVKKSGINPQSLRARFHELSGPGVCRLAEIGGQCPSLLSNSIHVLDVESLVSRATLLDEVLCDQGEHGLRNANTEGRLRRLYSGRPLCVHKRAG